MALWVSDFETMLATALLSVPANSRRKKHHRHLLTDSLKREEEGEQLSYGLMAVSTHRRYGQQQCTLHIPDVSRRI